MDTHRRLEDAAPIAARLIFWGDVHSALSSPQVPADAVVKGLSRWGELHPQLQKGLLSVARDILLPQLVRDAGAGTTLAKITGLLSRVESGPTADLYELAVWCVSHGYGAHFDTLVDQGLTSLALARQGITSNADVRGLLSFKFMPAKVFLQKLQVQPHSATSASPSTSTLVDNAVDDGFITDFSGGFVGMISGVTMAPDCATLQHAFSGVQLYEGQPEYSKKLAHMTAFAATEFAKQTIVANGGDPADPTAVDHNGLCLKDIAALNAYTQDSVYKPLNKMLNVTKDRVKRLKSFFRYMRLLMGAMKKLPPFAESYLVRGIKWDLCANPKHYQVGQKFRWWGFVSTTLDAETAKTFSKPDSGGVGTIFSIKTCIGVRVDEYSSYTSEKEVCLQGNYGSIEI